MCSDNVSDTRNPTERNHVEQPTASQCAVLYEADI